MSTIQEVARAAGVSVATVSRALSRPDVVADTTRRRVMAAVDALHYAPNAAAKNLRTAQSRRIVVTVPDIANPFFSQVIRGLEEAARIEGYAVVLVDVRYDPEEEARHGEMLRRREADGLIFLGHTIPSSVADLVRGQKRRAPVVNGCEFSPGIGVPSAHIDNAVAAREMMDYLYGLGHRRIGVVTGPLVSPLSRDRLAGVKASAAKRRAASALTVSTGDFSIQSGAAAAEALLALPQRPTALFCFSDEMALGALHAARRLRLRVPQDLSVAGFDDIRFAEYANPSLTTIRQPAAEIGRETVRMLMALIQQRSGVPLQRTLPHSLIVRDSTAAP